MFGASVRHSGRRSLVPCLPGRAAVGGNDRGPRMSIRHKSRPRKPVNPVDEVELPQFDLLNMKQNIPEVKVHNPLIELEIKEKQDFDRRQQELAEGIRRHIPKVRGSHPLSLEEEYMAARRKFLSDFRGIDQTPTRKFRPQEMHEDKFNIKHAFGMTKLFMVEQANIKMRGIERRFENEFHFNKGSGTHEDRLHHLMLYMRFMHSAQTSLRKTYMDDFFYIIKAIRLNSRGHRKLKDNPLYMQQIMSYLLLCNQPHMAMYLSRDYMATMRTEDICRWHMARLLDNPRMYLPDRDEINAMQALETGQSRSKSGFEVEYRFNMVAQSILRYYFDIIQDRKRGKRFEITDAELIYLIRCFEARQIKSSLLALLPMVIKRFVAGASAETLTSTKAQLFYDPDILVSRVDDSQVVMRYAHALLEVCGIPECARMLKTIADMPPKPCGDLPVDTHAVAGVLLRMFKLEDSVTIWVKQVLQILGTNDAEDMARLSTIKFAPRDRVTRIIANSRLSNSNVTGLLGELLKRPISSLPSQEVMRIIEFKGGDGRANEALGWVMDNFQKLSSEAQGSVLKWLTEKLSADREAVIRFICGRAKVSPLLCAQLVHVLCRRLWEREADRRHILASAFWAVAQSMDAEATGVLLVTAAMGPDTPVLSQFGPQSIRERSISVGKLVGRVGDIVQARPNELIPYLFKVASSLEAKETERALWRELLRQGIEPDWRMLQSAISLRTSKRTDHEQAMELIEHVMRIYPIENTGQSDELTTEALPADRPALYLSILKGLSHSGMIEPFKLLAHELLNNKHLNARAFNALASSWLDTVGHGPGASSSDVHHVWRILKEKATSAVTDQNGAAFKLGRNQFHAAISAYVRVGDISSAWCVIHDEMPAHSFAPNLATFYTLVAPLASASKLWPVGKSVVAKFNTHYRDIVDQAVNDKSNTLIVKALLRQALQSPEN